MIQPGLQRVPFTGASRGFGAALARSRVASKFGLPGFGASLHREVRERGVRLTTVMPGVIDSTFNEANQGTRDASWVLPIEAVATRIVARPRLPHDVVVDELTIHPAHGDY